MPPFHFTPFVESILNMIREECQPTNKGWEIAICRRLQQRYHHELAPAPGKPVSSEGLFSLHGI